VGKQIQIRLATPEDAPAVANVLHESFVEFEALYTAGGFAATTPYAAQVLVRISEGPVWIAMHDGVVMGTVAAVVKGESIYIRGMAVLPAARGSGTGAALLRQVEDWARNQGGRRLFLTTTPFLSAAIHLYERFGFCRIEEAPIDLFGTPLFTMEKPIIP
jgi:GNAT superfamily N-acetyltransferase